MLCSHPGLTITEPHTAVEKVSIRKEKGRSRKPRDDDEKYGGSRHRRHTDTDGSDGDAKGKQLVRRGKPRDRSDSEASDSDREDKKSRKKQLARRGKSKDRSESEDDRKHRKSKSKDKKGKGKSKKRQDSDEEDSDEEVIVTKTKKYEDVDIYDLDVMYLETLKKTFGANDEKVQKWCHNSLIRLDKSTGALNADKLLKKQDDDDEIKEWAIFEKKYMRIIKERNEAPKAPGGPSISYRDPIYKSLSIIERVYRPDACIWCRNRGHYCGHQF